MRFEKLGLVLSGGGGKGAYQLGVWKALREFGLETQVKAIAGTSVGALNGALFAQNKYDLAESMWLNIESRNMLSLNTSPMLTKLISRLASAEIVSLPTLSLLQQRGIYSQEGLKSMIREGFDPRDLQASRVPLTVALHDMHANRVEYRRLNDDPDADRALLATAALPLIFDPVDIGSKTYSDGGFYWGLPHKHLDNTPIRPLVEAGCDTIIVVCLSQDDLQATPNQFPGCRLIPIVSSAGYGDVTAPLDFSDEGARWRMDQGYGDACKVLQHLQRFVDNEAQYEALWQRTLAQSANDASTRERMADEDTAHARVVSDIHDFDRIVDSDDFTQELSKADEDDTPQALSELALQNTALLTALERGDIESQVERFLTENRNNRKTVETAALDAVAALSPVTGRAAGLRDQDILSRLWNSITGKNQKVLAENDHALAQAQFAALRLIAGVQEKGAITLEFSCALQNRLNGAYQDIARQSERHNRDLKRVYGSLARVYLKLRDRLLDAESRIHHIEKRLELNEWLDHPDIPRLHGMSLRQLPVAQRIACLANDFFRLTEARWTSRELMSLRQMCVNVGLGDADRVPGIGVYAELEETPETRQALFADLALPETAHAPHPLPASQWLTDLRDQRIPPGNVEDRVHQTWGVAPHQNLSAWEILMDLLYHLREAGLTAGRHRSLDTLKQGWLKGLQDLDKLVADKQLPASFGTQISALRGQIESFRLSVTFTGKFSSGKSTLLNAWLDESIQPEHADPCTTIATEFHYASPGQEKMVVVSHGAGTDGLHVREEYAISDYHRMLPRLEDGAAGVAWIELYRHLPALERHPDLVLVDMPGLCSGKERHIQAIERYIGEATAFILCVTQAHLGEDEMSFVDRQLQLGQTLALLVCKEDQIGRSRVEAVRESIARQVGLDPSHDMVRGCVGKGEVDLGGLADILDWLEQRKESLFTQTFAEALRGLLQQAERLVRHQLSANTNAGELKARKESIGRKLAQLKEEFQRERQRLLSDCATRLADRISSDVASFLRSRRSAYVALAKSGQDVGQWLSADANNAFKLAVNQTLSPELQRVAHQLHAAAVTGDEPSAVAPGLELGVEDGSNALGGAAAGAAAGASLAAAGAAFGSVVPIVGTAIGALLGGIIGALFGSGGNDVEQKVVQAIEQVITNVRKAAPSQLTQIGEHFFAQVSAQVEARLKGEAETLEQIEERLKADTATRQSLQQTAHAALEKLRPLLAMPATVTPECALPLSPLSATA